VLTDRLVSKEVLEHVRPEAQVVDVGKTSWTGTAPRQDEINAQLVAHARAGKRVVRLKGGDPFVFGRGSEEAQALVDAGVPFEVVPGVSSAIAVPAYAGIPVTARGHTQDVCVVTGHLDPDDPASPGALAGARDRPGHARHPDGAGPPAAADPPVWSGTARPADTPAACIEQGTTSEQRVVVSTLEHLARDVAEAGLHAPVTTVVGDVVRLRDRLRWFAPDLEDP
jgi:siroheme synthase